MEYDILFNNRSCRDFGILPVKRPNVQTPSKEVETIQIPGRSGILIVDHKRYEPIVLNVEFNFAAREEQWNKIFRSAKRWLLDGKGRLEFSDDADYFYQVYFVRIEDGERETRRIGRFTASFTCDPYMYLKRGLREYDVKEVAFNPYDTAHPIYKIKGEGVCVVSVNGKEMRANIGQNLTIDTELMMSYREDRTLQNTVVTGDYENLYLKAGDNTISISKGFGVKVIPNWRSL